MREGASGRKVKSALVPGRLLRMSEGKNKELSGARVYQSAIEAAMQIFRITKTFPAEEKYSMVDQIRRCSRSVCANIGEAWRKRRYPAHFFSKLSDAEAEAEETRVGLEIACRCHYINESQRSELDESYDKILGQLVRMMDRPSEWTIVRK